MKVSTSWSYYQRVHNVLEYVVRHIDEDLSISTLAQVAHFSPFHFHRIFKAITNETVGDFMRRIKLEVAAYLLGQNEKSIAIISMRCGYESAESFSRAFKRSYGVPPSAYRKSNPCPVSLASESRVIFDPEQMTIGLTPYVGDFKMQIDIITKSAVKYAFIGHKGDYKKLVGVFDQLLSWAEQAGVDFNSAGIFSQSYKSPLLTPKDELYSEACIAIGNNTLVTDGVEEKLRKSRRYAIYTLKGSYEGISQAYQQMLGQWLPSTTEELDDSPFVEIYKSDERVLPESEWLTELCMPLK